MLLLDLFIVAWSRSQVCIGIFVGFPGCKTVLLQASVYERDLARTHKHTPRAVEIHYFQSHLPSREVSHDSFPGQRKMVNANRRGGVIEKDAK